MTDVAQYGPLHAADESIMNIKEHLRATQHGDKR